MSGFNKLEGLDWSICKDDENNYETGIIWKRKMRSRRYGVVDDLVVLLENKTKRRDSLVKDEMWFKINLICK